MYKDFHTTEQVLLSNPEIRAKMEQVVKIILDYYPESSPQWGVRDFGQYDECFDVFLGTIENGLEAGLNIEFGQDWDDDNFPSNCYKLVRIEFYTHWIDKRSLDISYVCIGDENYNGWITNDRPPNQDKATQMSDEIFASLKDLAISPEVVI